MVNYDPRRLIQVLNEITDDYRLFSQTARDVMSEAEYVQRQSRELINQWIHTRDRIRDQVLADLEAVAETDARVKKLESLTEKARAKAQVTIRMMTKAQEKAEATLARWKKELAAALAWQRQAEKQLQDAIAVLRQAEAALSSAKSRRSSAESSLNSCRNDRDRRNCNSEVNAYNRAQAEVQAATEAVQVAAVKVREAEAELARAKAKVSCCKRAVDYSKIAVKKAIGAVERASTALVYAEKSSESAASARRATDKAEDNAITAEDVANQLSVRVNQAQQLTDEAQADSRKARQLSDAAHLLYMRGTQELSRRVIDLATFNRPSPASLGVNMSMSDRPAVSAAPSMPSNPKLTDRLPYMADDPAIKAWVENLTYKDVYKTIGSQESEYSIRIEAHDGEKGETGFIIAHREKSGRVKIKDTIVPPKYRRRGIGPKLFSLIEDAFPSGTELFFNENERPSYWARRGFQERKDENGIVEFFKIIP